MARSHVRTVAGAVDVDGLRVGYRQVGDGPAVVLLHGYVGDGEATWHRQLNALGGEFRLVAWDAPGAGASADPPESFGMAGYADCLAGFIAALGVDEPASRRAVLRRRARARRRRSAPGPGSVARRRVGLRRLGRIPAARRRRPTAVPSLGVVRVDVRRVRRHVAADDVRDAAGSRPTSIGSRPACGRSIRAASAPWPGHRPRTCVELLASVDVPTLLVYGDQDVRAPLPVAEHLHTRDRRLGADGPARPRARLQPRTPRPVQRRPAHLAAPSPVSGLAPSRSPHADAQGSLPGDVRSGTRCSSEHHEVDVVAGEDRAGRGHRVAPDDEVLRDGVDVAQTALQRAVDVDGGTAAGAVGGVDDGRRSFRRPHRGGADCVPGRRASARCRRSPPPTTWTPSRTAVLAPRAARCRPSPGRTGTSGSRRAAHGRAAASCGSRGRRCRRALPARSRSPRWRRRTRSVRAAGCARSARRCTARAPRTSSSARRARTGRRRGSGGCPVPASPDTCQVSSMTTSVGREQGDPELWDAVDQPLDAVAEDPVGVLAAAGEAPPPGRPGSRHRRPRSSPSG